MDTVLMDDLTDAEAIERCRAGEGAAHAPFRVLYERHEADVSRFLGSLLGDAEAVLDATQETFVRLYRSLGSFEEGRELRPWLFSIARHVAIDALRARKKSAPLNEATVGRGSEGDGLERAAESERARAIDDALAALAPEHRAVIALRHVHGLSQEEIARALSCTARTVRNRLRVAAGLFERELARRGVLAEGEGGRS